MSFGRSRAAGLLSIAAVLALAAGDPPVLSAARGAFPRRTVYAWFPGRFGSWDTSGTQWDCITHLCFRSVELQPDGSLRKPAGDPPKTFVETAHRHGVRVTVLAWVNSAAVSDAYLAHAPQQAADSLLAYVRQNDLDGVNIDDEQMRETNSVNGAPNRPLVGRFFHLLRERFNKANPRYHISFAAPPVISPEDRFATKWLDLKALAADVDAVIPMGYTMNPPSIGWTTNPEPLGGGGKGAQTTTRDLRTMVRDYLAAMGGRKKKLLPGVSVSFGGYEWQCRTDRRLAPIAGRGVPKSLQECEASARQHGSRWDDAQASPWYCYPGDQGLFVQGWYNDLKAWRERLDWIRREELGGIGVWVLDGAADPPERWQALRLYREARK